MKASSIVIFIGALAVSAAAAAQTGKVLRGKDVNESALIEALTPSIATAAPAEEESIRTRSIHVNREKDPASITDKPARAPAKPASASLLITFETNSTELTPRAKQSLNVVGQALTSDKLAEFRFAIEGHADPRGDSEANLRLSKLRAESVRQYLVQAKHIDDKRLDAVGKGSTEPINSTNPSAPENRRVTFVNLAK